MKTILKWRTYQERWELQRTKEVPNLPPLKKFKPKTNISTLDIYRQDADNVYWSQWPAISWETARLTTSNIQLDVLYSLAMECEYPQQNYI